MINGTQCKMARAALGWTTRDLAERAQVGIMTISRFEAGEGKTYPATKAAIARVLETGGIEFLEGDEGEVGALLRTPAGTDSDQAGKRPAKRRRPQQPAEQPVEHDAGSARDAEVANMMAHFRAANRRDATTMPELEGWFAQTAHLRPGT